MSTEQTIENTERGYDIWAEGSSVFLRAPSPWGDVTVREFWVPSGGGYVRELDEWHPGLSGRQVCLGLSAWGTTLWSSPSGLLALIRREYGKSVARRRIRGARR